MSYAGASDAAGALIYFGIATPLPPEIAARAA
jgi:hypothetical protein